jgi:N-acetylglucosaminyl-diphospho-decaprenol L-rhamnosyltransferase
LHCEDLDLCRRARNLGLVVALVEGVRVTHLKGTSSAAHPYFVTWHKHRGMWRYYRKFDGARHPWPLRALIASGIAARCALHIMASALRIRSSDTRA